MLSAFDNFPALLIWLPLIGGLVAFLMKEEGQAKTWALFSSTLTLILMGASLLYTDAKFFKLNQVSYYWLRDIGSSFAFNLDGMASMLCLLTAISFPLIFASTWNRSYKNANAFYGLMLLTQCGLMGVFMATDALVFYFFWELALIPVYFLASQWGGEKRIQAAFKFFIYTFAGSLLMLIGLLYIYLKTGGPSFSLAAFYNVQLSAGEQTWLFWLFFVAFAIKMPVFPFHTWQPDAYEQSTTAVTMVLSGVMVKMGVFALIRWLLPMFPEAVAKFDNVVIGLAVVGMIYASLIAMRQDDLKRLVAYSSIAHIGLMAAAVFTVEKDAMQGVMLQMFSHGVNIIGLWIVIELIEQQLGVRKISQLGGIAQKAPILTILLVVIALANVALPLTNAFVGEFLMFSGLFRFNAWYAAFAGISIILSAVYTLNMIKHVFYGPTNTLTEGFREIGAEQRVILAVIVVVIFMVGVFPGPMFELVEQVSDVVVKRLTDK
ncbi:MAG: NADH-quinone oxidoreductase subunit M [Chitinophagaceae bacterium]|jgi:NADH-quinone oxidoreductase subunit M|nr:NADH-quinone oxidoreductase subunit M [Chitinophagaceae bacterium]